MLDLPGLMKVGNASIVAPAGHGKTEEIAKIAALGQRTLVLTHTHAGVHAIRTRLKRLGVPHSRAAVDTIAGWSMRYSHAFPGVAKPPVGMPEGAEWEQLYAGATLALKVNAVREVIAASYDRVLIDEYQDCNISQHRLALALSSIIPTLIFGDPMQGIFEFAGATLNWKDEIFPNFPTFGTLEIPRRWEDKNRSLGEWIAETREKLLRGETIDLGDPRITYRESRSAFDMETLFDGIDGKIGNFAAIHCNKSICYKLARAANGGYQAIEELAAKRLREFAKSWDSGTTAAERHQATSNLFDNCFNKREAAEDPLTEDTLKEIIPHYCAGNGAEAVMQFLTLSRNRPGWKLFRNELWRDCEVTTHALYF